MANANVEKTTEELIEDDHIKGFLGEEGKEDAENENTEQAADGETQEPDAGKQEAGEQQGKQADRTGSEGNSAEQQQPSKQGAQAADPNAKLVAGKFKTDAKGNLYDAQNKLVAKAGAESRLFLKANALSDELQRTQQHVQRIAAENRKLREGADFNNTLSGYPAKLGLNAEEAHNGLAIVAALKTNPVKTIQYLIDHAQKQGYNINIQGGEGNAAGQQGPDVQALIRQELQTHLKPLLEPQQAALKQQQVQQQVEKEYNDFIATHPYSQNHEDVLAAMMDKDQTLSADQAYTNLRVWAAEKGFDFTQPLGPQIQAAAQSAQQSRQPQQNARQPQKPMPNGRGNTGGNLVNHKPVNLEASTGDIVKEAMAEAGFNVNF